jgi:uncharacterized protein YkwD
MRRTLFPRLRSAAALGVILAAAGCSVAPETHVVAPRAALARASLSPAAATADLNAYRAASGLAPVRLDPALNAVAERQAEAMAASGTISHDVGGSFSSRLAAGGIENVAAGENVGAGYASFDEALASWRASPGHNENLLMPGATRFGVGLAKTPGDGYGTYWAMEVADEPRSAPAGIHW